MNLVEGWWTEYGGMRFGLLFAAEYMRVYAASILFAHFFMGGWHAPFAGTIGALPYIGEAYLAIPESSGHCSRLGLSYRRIRLGKNCSSKNKNRPNLEFGWRMLLPLAVLQVVLSMVYRLYFYDASALDFEAGGWAWDLTILEYTIPWGLPILTTAFWLVSIRGLDERREHRRE